MTKYRIVKRAKGWAAQAREYFVDRPPGSPWVQSATQWHTISTHRFHFIAALRLLILRERERK